MMIHFKMLTGCVLLAAAGYSPAAGPDQSTLMTLGKAEDKFGYPKMYSLFINMEVFWLVTGKYV